MRRSRQKVFVRSVCFLLAALLLFLALSAQIRLRAVEAESAALKSEIEELEKKKELLSARLAGCLSLGEIERRACGELGMCRCRGDQIRVIGIEEDDDE